MLVGLAIRFIDRSLFNPSDPIRRQHTVTKTEEGFDFKEWSIGSQNRPSQIWSWKKNLRLEEIETIGTEQYVPKQIIQDSTNK